MSRKTIIMSKLRENGYRITTQRELLIGIILENECSSCKEIYYKAIKEDPKVGLATVYRMIKTLEDLQVINRKNLYNISYDNLDNPNQQQIILFREGDDNAVEVPKGNWFKDLEKELEQMGYTNDQDLSIVIKVNPKKRSEEEQHDKLCNSCKCNNIRCKHHCKRDTAS